MGSLGFETQKNDERNIEGGKKAKVLAPKSFDHRKDVNLGESPIQKSYTGSPNTGVWSEGKEDKHKWKVSAGIFSPDDVKMYESQNPKRLKQSPSAQNLIQTSLAPIMEEEKSNALKEIPIVESSTKTPTKKGWWRRIFGFCSGSGYQEEAEKMEIEIKKFPKTQTKEIEAILGREVGLIRSCYPG